MFKVSVRLLRLNILSLLTALCCCFVVSQQELCSMWCELQRERPELLSVLESVLVHTVSHLQDSIRERDSLEQALRRSTLHYLCLPLHIEHNINSAKCNRWLDFVFLFRRESEHDQVVRSIYEDLESQLREERQKRQAQVQILRCFHNLVVWSGPSDLGLNFQLWKRP